MRLCLLSAALLLAPVSAHAQWIQMSGPEFPVVTGLAEAGGVLVMGAGEADHGATFRSDDGGRTWADAALRKEVFTAHGAGSTLYVGTYLDGLWRSTDGARSWTQVEGGLPVSGSFGAMAGASDTLFAAPFFQGTGALYRSTDAGGTWTPLAVGFQVSTRALLKSGPVVLVGSEGSGLRRSPDGGAMWAAPGGIPSSAHVGGFAAMAGALFAGVWMPAQPTQSGLYRSTDRGATWVRVASNLPSGAFENLGASGGLLFAGLGTRAAGTPGLFRSADGGATWTPLVGVPTDANGGAFLLTTDGLLVGSSLGAFRSDDEGQTWAASSDGSAGVRGVGALLADGPLYVGLTTNGGGGRELWRTGSLGTEWERVEDGLPPRVVVEDLLRDGSTLLAATAGIDRGVYRSTDGTVWTAGTGISPSAVLRALGAHGGVYFAGAFDALYRSTDGGATWTTVPGITNVSALVSFGGAIYAGSYGDGVLRSTDGGQSWTDVSAGLTTESARFANTFTVHAGALYLATQGGGVFRLDGSVWTPLGAFASGFVNDLLSVGDVLLAATPLGAHLYASTNGGAVWMPFAEGYSGFEVYELALVGEQLVAGTRGDALWMRPASELPFPVAAEPTAEPTALAVDLGPNPATAGVVVSIRYTLPRGGAVRLAVFDARGRRVRGLTEGRRGVGTHTATLSTEGLRPGAYLVRLNVGDAVRTARLTLVR